MVIEIRSKLVKTITSKHYFALISIFCQLQLISMGGHRIQINGHQIQINGHRIQINGHWIQIYGHQNQKQIGRNNHPQTLFHTHSYILSYRKSVQQNSITSKHYFTLIPIFCQIENGSSKSNHLQTLYDTLQKPSSQTKPRECQREKKDGLA